MVGISQAIERNHDRKVSILAKLGAEIVCDGSHYQLLAFHQYHRHSLLATWNYFLDHKRSGKWKANDLMNDYRLHDMQSFQED